MPDVLHDLLRGATLRAKELPARRPPPSTRPDFRSAVRGKERISVIAEFKRSSPSLGEISTTGRPSTTARAYEHAGVAAMSVLTEPTRFHGSGEDLQEAAGVTRLPLLMKDFVVAPEQVYQACRIGASGVLLIVRCLPAEVIRDLSDLILDLGMTPLIECHSASEVDCALSIEEAVIGINNRDLDTLEVDRRTGPALLSLVPPDRIAVAESGYDDPSQLEELRGLADAVLIGTALLVEGGHRAADFVARGEA